MHIRVYLYEADFDTATSENREDKGFFLVQTGHYYYSLLFRVRIEGLVSVRRGRCGPRHGGACVLYRDATLFGDGHDGQFTVYICSYLRIKIIIVLVQEYMECSTWDWPFQFNAACCYNFPLLLYSMSFMLSAGQAK